MKSKTLQFGPWAVVTGANSGMVRLLPRNSPSKATTSRWSGVARKPWRPFQTGRQNRARHNFNSRNPQRAGHRGGSITEARGRKHLDRLSHVCRRTRRRRRSASKSFSAMNSDKDWGVLNGVITVLLPVALGDRAHQPFRDLAYRSPFSISASLALTEHTDIRPR
jgi:hypothetical protein